MALEYRTKKNRGHLVSPPVTRTRTRKEIVGINILINKLIVKSCLWLLNTIWLVSEYFSQYPTSNTEMDFQLAFPST